MFKLLQSSKYLLARGREFFDRLAFSEIKLVDHQCQISGDLAYAEWGDDDASCLERPPQQRSTESWKDL